jgi:hypothetical protein
MNRFLINTLTVWLALAPALVGADGYSTEYEHQAVDESKVRRILAHSDLVKAEDIWYASGEETYWKSPSCVAFRDLYTFSKPVQSSPGIWRGKQIHIEEHSESAEHPTCTELQATIKQTLDTASFIDPVEMHPDESYDGLVPGVFLTDLRISDSELLMLARLIPEALSCLEKKTNSCGYETLHRGTAPTYMLFPAIKTGKLTSIFLVHVVPTNQYYYELRFDTKRDYGYQVALDVYYRGEAVSKVVLSDPILYVG